MQVKIGDVIYNSENKPIMIILSEEEKKLIASMHNQDLKFCSYPEDGAEEEIINFMKLDIDSSIPKNQDKQFPILGESRTIPWAIIEKHREQAMKNHYQTLERLAERGGLDWVEVLAVIEDRDWIKMDKEEAEKKVLKIIGIGCICCGKKIGFGEFAYNQDTCWDCFKNEVQVMHDNMGWYPSWLWTRRKAHQEILNHLLACLAERMGEKV